MFTRICIICVSTLLLGITGCDEPAPLVLDVPDIDWAQLENDHPAHDRAYWETLLAREQILPGNTRAHLDKFFPQSLPSAGYAAVSTTGLGPKTITEIRALDKVWSVRLWFDYLDPDQRALPGDRLMHPPALVPGGWAGARESYQYRSENSAESR